MDNQRFTLTRIKTLSRSWQLRMLLAVSLIWLVPTLACGSFAPRPLPTPTIAVVTPVDPQADSGGTGGVVVAPGVSITPTLALIATDTPMPAPTAVVTSTVASGTALAKGQPARVTTEDGLNLRDNPTTGGQLLTRLAGDQKVTIVDGPVTADNFTWWKLDDGQGNVGWAVQGDKDEDWLSPQLGVPKPVNRAPKIGERVQVTTEGDQLLTIRATPGRDGTVLAQVGNGKQYTVIAGPQSANGFTWYQIRSDDGSLVGWTADGDDTTRWLSPLE